MNLRFLVGLLALPIMACNGLYGAGDDDDDDDDGEENYPPETNPNECSYDPSYCNGTRTSADAGVGDAAADADAAYPPVDSSVAAADLTGCAGDAGLAYTISSKNDLSIFDPSTFTTTTLGALDCSFDGSPVAMTASRTGMLYVLYEDGYLSAVDPASRSCAHTSWSDESDFIFDIGVAIQRTNGVEALSVLTDAPHFMSGKVLSRADLATTTTAVVGDVPLLLDPPLSDLVSDAYNRLFVLTGPHVMNLDPATGAVLGVDAIPGFPNPEELNSLTGMVIGQNVYELAIETSGTTVYRYDLHSKQTTAVVQLNADVAVATAVPCSP